MAVASERQRRRRLPRAVARSGSRPRVVAGDERERKRECGDAEQPNGGSADVVPPSTAVGRVSGSQAYACPDSHVKQYGPKSRRLCLVEVNPPLRHLSHADDDRRLSSTRTGNRFWAARATRRLMLDVGLGVEAILHHSRPTVGQLPALPLTG